MPARKQMTTRKVARDFRVCQVSCKRHVHRPRIVFEHPQGPVFQQSSFHSLRQMNSVGWFCLFPQCIPDNCDQSRGVLLCQLLLFSGSSQNPSPWSFYNSAIKKPVESARNIVEMGYPPPPRNWFLLITSTTRFLTEGLQKLQEPFLCSVSSRLQVLTPGAHDADVVNCGDTNGSAL